MTAFCVYGVSMKNCRAVAERKTKSKAGKDVGQLEAQRLWIVEVEAKAKELFEAAKRSRQISPVFDTPDFCRDWLSVAAPEEVRMAKIMVRGPKMDKKGNRVTKDGVQVMTWVTYNGTNAFGSAKHGWTKAAMTA